MRRNAPRGGGRRDMESSKGPLMTEHLQDLELEIELLKRKRLMITQQQSMLAQQSMYGRQSQPFFEQQQQSMQQHYGGGRSEQIFQRRPYEFDKPLFNEQPYDIYNQSKQPNRNFAHLYDDPETTFSNNQHGTKRQADNNWQTDPKRFSAEPLGGNVANKFGNRLGPKPIRGQPLLVTPNPSDVIRNMNRKPQKGPKPLLSLRTNPPANFKLNDKPNSLRTDFKPRRAKAKVAPNKINSLPVAERKKIITESIKVAPATKKVATVTNKVAPVTNKVAEDEEKYMLHPDREVNRQTMGRLELALGRILKTLKDQYSETETYKNCFENANRQRMMKSVIRERLRTVMLGKIVGHVNSTLEIYNKEFPPETNKDILKVALDATTEASKIKLPITLSQSDDARTFFKTNMSKIIEVRLNEMFTKLEEIYGCEVHKDVIANLVGNEDPKDNQGSANVEEDQSKVASEDPKEKQGTVDVVEDEMNVASEDPKEKQDTPDVEEDQMKVVSEDSIEKQNTADVEADKMKNTVEEINKMDPHLKEYIELIVMRSLPKLLKKSVPHIIKLLNVDQMYHHSKMLLTKTAVNKEMKSQEGSKKKQKQSRESINNVENATEEQPQPFVAIKYFVKILGRPSLPKRKVMQTFLDTFSPKTIKKHKYMHNLLFVGFAEKKDYDNILLADKTTLGNSILEIKTSEKKADEQNKDNTNSSLNESKEDSGQVSIKSENSVSTELDSQITDLLTSIRQADEGKNDNHAVSNGIEENTENDETDTQNVITESKEKNDGVTVVKQEPISEKSCVILAEGDHENNINAEEGHNKANEETGTKSVEMKLETPLETIKEVEKGTAGNETNKAEEKVENEVKNQILEGIKDVKESGTATPTRSSSRLANTTPSTIRTRRASRLAQNNNQ